MTTAEPPPGEARIIPLARPARRAAAAARSGAARPVASPGAADGSGHDGSGHDETAPTKHPTGASSAQEAPAPARQDPAPSAGSTTAKGATTRRAATKSGSRPGTGRQTSARQTSARQTSARQASLRQASAEPAAAEPVAAKPLVAKPSAAKSGAAKARTDKPGSDNPGTGEPSAAEPGTGKPATGKPVTDKSATGQAAGVRAGRSGTGQGRSSARARATPQPEQPEDRAERLLGRAAGQLRGDEVTPDEDDVTGGPAGEAPAAPMAQPAGLERALAGMLAFLRRRITGDYEVDELGFDADLTEHVVAPLLRPVYRNYFRVETRGLENVPDTGGALVVANHSGTLPIDALMTAVALLDHHPSHRYLRMLAADLVFSLPFIAPIARKTGNTMACQPDAERLLGKGELVGVWPEGFKGVGKPFSERYKLQRFGRGGFVSAALRTGVPIIPCTIVGAEEIYPMLGNAKAVARLLGLPYFPLTPTFPWFGALGMIPLPSKWLIEFGEPVETASLTPAAAEDPMLVFELTDRIRETIQHTLYGLLMQRRSVFF